MLTLTTLFNIVLEVLARAIRQEKEIKGIQIGKEELSEKEIRKTIPFIIAPKRIKYLGNLTKEVGT